MTPEERTRAVCEEMEAALRRMGFITTAHYEAGTPIILAAIRAAVAEERERCCRVALCWANSCPWNGRELAERIARDIEAGK